MNEKASYKIIFSKTMAYDLRKMGFHIVKTEPNKKRPELDCYFFEDTPEFEDAMTKANELAQARKKARAAENEAYVADNEA